MSGNWATGIALSAMSPASVMTIARTKASRGRSTKMAEIKGVSAADAGRSRVDRDDLARPHLLHALDDDLLALLEAGLDDDVGPLVRPGGDPPLLGLVVGCDHHHVVAGLVDLQRG